MLDPGWKVEEVKCGMCRRWSEQTVAPDLTSEDAHDLDGRPGEPLRSALLFQLGRCPHCFYVGSADSLSAPDKRRLRTAVAGLLESRAYRKLSGDRALPIAARTYLCRAWIDSVLDDPARAFMGALFAAWVCDDEGLDAAAVAVRGQALEYWEAAREAGTLPYAESPTGVSETIRAELLRRVGRFAESIEQAVATLALPDVHDVVELPLAYIADRAARGDRENHTVEEACEPQTSELDPRLISHDQGIEYRRALIGGAIRTVLAREREPGESDDAIVFNGGDYYVQILLRRERLEIYAEAVDPDVWGTGSLSDDQRELLERLGWTPRGRRRAGELQPHVPRRDAGRARGRGDRGAGVHPAAGLRRRRGMHARGCRHHERQARGGGREW